jgi:hypothetical protein
MRRRACCPARAGHLALDLVKLNVAGRLCATSGEPGARTVAVSSTMGRVIAIPAKFQVVDSPRRGQASYAA